MFARVRAHEHWGPQFKSLGWEWGFIKKLEEAKDLPTS